MRRINQIHDSKTLPHHFKTKEMCLFKDIVFESEQWEMFYHIKRITGDCLRTCCLPGAPQSAQRLLSGCFTSSSKIFLFRSQFDISAPSQGLLSHDTESRRRYRTCWSHGFIRLEMKVSPRAPDAHLPSLQRQEHWLTSDAWFNSARTSMYCTLTVTECSSVHLLKYDFKIRFILLLSFHATYIALALHYIK